MHPRPLRLPSVRGKDGYHTAGTQAPLALTHGNGRPARKMQNPTLHPRAGSHVLRPRRVRMPRLAPQGPGYTFPGHEDAERQTLHRRVGIYVSQATNTQNAPPHTQGPK